MFDCIDHVSENKEFAEYTVCGSDGVTYQRKWELDYYNCQHDSKLRIRHPGCDQLESPLKSVQKSVQSVPYIRRPYIRHTFNTENSL